MVSGQGSDHTSPVRACNPPFVVCDPYDPASIADAFERFQQCRAEGLPFVVVDVDTGTVVVDIAPGADLVTIRAASEDQALNLATRIWKRFGKQRKSTLSGWVDWKIGF